MRTSLMMIGVAAALCIPAQAHDWEELSTQIGAEKAAAALAVAEELQRNHGSAAPPLRSDALAIDWLEWLMQLARSPRAADELVASLIRGGWGFEDEPSLALENWQQTMGWLVETRDALRHGERIIDARRRFERGDVPQADAARISYLASLTSPTEDDTHLLTHLEPQLRTLIEAAKSSRGSE